MQFTCNRDILYEANNIVQKAASARTTLPILEGIKLEADSSENTLKLTCNNLEMAIESTITVNVIESGSIVINSKFFCDIIRKFPNDKIMFMVYDNNNINIKCGFAEFNTIGIVADEFPDIPKVNNVESFQISQKKLKSMIKQTIHAIALETINPILTGLLFEINDHNLNVVAVDGYRLALRKENIAQNVKNHTFVIPGKTVIELSRILSDDDTNVTISYTDNHVLFKIDNFTVLSNLLIGKFFNYREAIPKECQVSVRIKPRELFTSIERASLVIENGKYSHVLRCDFDNNVIKITCSDTRSGYNDRIETEEFRNKILIGLNIRYMLDALKNCEDDEVVMELNSSLTPLIIKPLTGDSFLFLVVPARI